MYPDITIRPATPADIPEILRQRRAMYEDMNYNDASALDAMAKLSADFLAKALTDGSFHAWLALENEGPIAGGAVIITPWPAHPYDLECRRATILNVYTDREYRRRGIARQLLQTMIAWCKREGLARVTLHASDQGRNLYESLGFEPSNEMRLKLR
jgi:GNAT superfamily N-acetyltransferase